MFLTGGFIPNGLTWNFHGCEPTFVQKEPKVAIYRRNAYPGTSPLRSSQHFAGGEGVWCPFKYFAQRCPLLGCSEHDAGQLLDIYHIDISLSLCQELSNS